MKTSERSPVLESSGFAVLRTPAHALRELREWCGDAPSSDRSELRDRLAAFIDREDVDTAIALASPSLHAELPGWRRAPDSRQGRAVERSLVRYLTRMTSRATPFGLFAGHAVVRVGDETNLRLAETSRHRLHVRLDAAVVQEIAEALATAPELVSTTKLRPSSTLHRVAGKLGVIQAQGSDRNRAHHLVRFEPSPFLDAALEHARGGETRERLARSLAREADVDLEEAEEYVEELAREQLLVPDLRPCLTGPSSLDELTAQVGEHAGGGRWHEALVDLNHALGELGRDGTPSPGLLLSRLTPTLETLSVPTPGRALVHLELIKSAPEATLSENVTSQLADVLEFLRGASDFDHDRELGRFRDAFVERYGEREIPLVQALDEEAGIGYGNSSSTSSSGSPLLAGLPLDDEAGTGRAALEMGSRDIVLHEILERWRRSGADELVLSDADVAALRRPESPPFPDALTAGIRLAPSGQDDHARFLFEGAVGPSGAQLLGRFCTGDATLREHVAEHLAREEALRPDAAFAEVVHVPEGRDGNVVHRPQFRKHEIPFLGRSGAPVQDQIPLDDLLVSVVDDRVVLRSARFGKEVVPRLTTAHSADSHTLGVYRFLSDLQFQGVAGWLQWNWGSLEAQPSLPRVCLGNTVLSLARWRLSQHDLRRLSTSAPDERPRLLTKWRRRHAWPRFVVFGSGDSELLVDLDNELMVDSLLDLLLREDEAVLREHWGGFDDLPVTGPEGDFVHELFVPMTLRREPTPEPSLPRVELSGCERTFAPGSEWLYARIFTGPASADDLLCDVVRPLVERWMHDGVVDRWFFIRLQDPDPTVRLRVHGEPGRLLTDVVPQLHAALREPLRNGLAWRVQLDTYERELERYGGRHGMELSERLFHADSDAVLRLVALSRGSSGADLRWRLALVGIQQLLEDLLPDIEDRHHVIRSMRAGYLREHGGERALRVPLGARYRSERRHVQHALDAPELTVGKDAMAVFQERSRALAEIVPSLRAHEQAGHLSMTELAVSYLHMFVNRLVRSHERAHELVLHDFLDRLHVSRAARSRAEQAPRPLVTAEVPAP
ncbi:MAG: lantibiotic dehydratase [Acidobacteriota bacterium]